MRKLNQVDNAGKTTVNSLYGTRVAVLAGDYLFAQSSWHLAQLDNLEVRPCPCACLPHICVMCLLVQHAAHRAHASSACR